MSDIFSFRGSGEHDFRPRNPDSDAWLECVHCGIVTMRDSSGTVGAMFDCYQEQLLMRDPEGEHASPSPDSSDSSDTIS